MSDFKKRISALVDQAIATLEESADFTNNHNIKHLETLTKIVSMTETWAKADGGLDDKSVADLEAMLAGGDE